MASSGSVQARGRKPALRAELRQALAKQEAEQQQLRQRSMLDTKSPSSSRALTAVRPLQTYHVSVINYSVLSARCCSIAMHVIILHVLMFFFLFDYEMSQKLRRDLILAIDLSR